MAKVRSRGNKCTELALLQLFRESRIVGWRRHTKLLGRPDFTFYGQRVAVFIDGCFWHRCPKHSNVPTSNRQFWQRKLEANAARDRLVTRTLRRGGWRVVRIWEHDLKKRSEWCVSRIRLALDQ